MLLLCQVRRSRRRFRSLYHQPSERM